MIASSTVQPVHRMSSGRFDLAELTALAMTIVIGVGAFAWSFAALTGLAVMAGITPRLAWVGPIFVDGAIVQSAVALVSLQRRARQHVVIPKGTLRFFWSELFTAELISVVGNGLHAAESGQRVLPAAIAAFVAGAAPVFGLAATHGLTALIEVPRSPQPDLDTDATAVHADSTRLDSNSARPNTDWTALDDDRPALDGGQPVTVETVDTEPVIDRDTEIRRRHAAGESMRAIGAAMNLSSSRVGQIIAATDHDEDGGEVLSLVR